MRVEKICPALSINSTQIKIYNTLHPEAAAYTFFSRAHETVSKENHILVIKQLISEVKELKSYKICSLTTVESCWRKIFGKCSNIWKLDNTLLKFHGQGNLKDNLKIL